MALGAAGCARDAGEAPGASAWVLTPMWTVEGLASPESVLLSADSGFFYVSNVNGEGGDRDGNGFISRVSRDGIMLEREWAKGLDAPKGMTLKDGKLYVADISRLVVLDSRTGKIDQVYEAPGAKFLNDVAMLADGTVIAADSDTGAIYRFDGPTAVVWIRDPQLRSINGLLPVEGKLYITTMQGLLIEADPQTRSLRVLARNLGEADGLARLEDGSFLVSEWPGRIFHVTASGEVTTITDTRAAESFINDFLVTDDLTRKVLVAPHWKPGSLTQYDLSRAPSRP